MLKLLAAVLLALAPTVAGAAQDATNHAPPQGFERITESLFAADLPAGWRSMTPDEMFGLRDQLPLTMRDVQPNWFYAIGDVDGWLQNGFDGNTLLVHVQKGEIPVDEDSIKQIRDNWSENDAVGGRRSVVEAEATTVGRDAHPAIRCEMITEAWEDMPPIVATDLYVPTSGHLVILSFRSWQDQVENRQAVHQTAIESLTFPKPPKKAEEVSDRFSQALMIGAGIGLVLIMLRVSSRRR